jgi:hypothetical protein
MAKIKTVVGPVKLNSATLRSILNGGEGMDKVLHSEAEKVLERARETAPIGETGDYYRSLHLEEQRTTDRLVIRVGASVWYAQFVEAAHHTLTKALAASVGRRGRK